MWLDLLRSAPSPSIGPGPPQSEKGGAVAGASSDGRAAWWWAQRRGGEGLEGRRASQLMRPLAPATSDLQELYSMRKVPPEGVLEVLGARIQPNGDLRSEVDYRISPWHRGRSSTLADAREHFSIFPAMAWTSGTHTIGRQRRLRMERTVCYSHPSSG